MKDLAKIKRVAAAIPDAKSLDGLAPHEIGPLLGGMLACIDSLAAMVSELADGQLRLIEAHGT